MNLPESFQRLQDAVLQKWLNRVDGLRAIETGTVSMPFAEFETLVGAFEETESALTAERRKVEELQERIFGLIGSSESGLMREKQWREIATTAESSARRLREALEAVLATWDNADGVVIVDEQERVIQNARAAISAEHRSEEPCPDCEGSGCVECDGPGHRSRA